MAFDVVMNKRHRHNKDETDNFLDTLSLSLSLYVFINLFNLTFIILPFPVLL